MKSRVGNLKNIFGAAAPTLFPLRYTFFAPQVTNCAGAPDIYYILNTKTYSIIIIQYNIGYYIFLCVNFLAGSNYN